MSLQSIQTWLKVASGIVIGFGAIGLLGSIPATAAPTRFLTDLAFWPVDGLPASDAPEIRLFWGILAGLLCGWGLLLWQIASRLLPRDPELARSLILTSMVTWFVIDSAGSLAAGAPVNAVMNVGFLLLFVVPFWRGRRAMAA